MKISLSRYVAMSKGDMQILFNDKRLLLKRFSVKSSELHVAVKKYSIDRTYPDELELLYANNAVTLVNKVNIDEYAHAAALNELGSLVQMDPLKRKELVSAMEIVIRSYRASQKARHRADYKVCA